MSTKPMPLSELIKLCDSVRVKQRRQPAAPQRQRSDVKALAAIVPATVWAARKGSK